MISLERCREILGDQSLPDDQVASIREAIYSIAFVAFDDYVSKANGTGDKACRSMDVEKFQFDRALTLVSEEVRTGIEERAAIKEFEGELGRDEAERSAVQEYIEARRI